MLEPLCNLLERLEGKRLTTYDDGFGGLTIGVGHLIVPHRDLVLESIIGPYKGMHLTITEAQCRQLLLADIQERLDKLDNMVDPMLLPHERDAILSLVFNIGTGAFSTSTCLKRLNNGGTEKVPQAILLWDKVTNPKTKMKSSNKGLLKRRVIEALIFMHPEMNIDLSGFTPSQRNDILETVHAYKQDAAKFNSGGGIK